MRFLMIAAAISVAALGFSGCATTGGCQSGNCGGDMIAGGGCDAGCTDCQASGTAECGCGGGGCASCLSGIHGGASGDYGGGLQNTGMAMTMFDRGPKCDGGGCEKSGCGPGLPCRAKGGCALGSGGLLSRAKGSCALGSGGLLSRAKGRCALGSCGLFSRIKAANEIALAEQDAEFSGGAGCGCGIGGCDGIGCGAGLHGRGAGLQGCGGKGCGLSGCKDCVRGVLQHSLGHPYGGAVPHTTPSQAGPPAGAAPTYAYPYYTTRGPRDFLAREPASIGY